jgi:hypothetical protein
LGQDIKLDTGPAVTQRYWNNFNWLEKSASNRRLRQLEIDLQTLANGANMRVDRKKWFLPISRAEHRTIAREKQEHFKGLKFSPFLPIII